MAFEMRAENADFEQSNWTGWRTKGDTVGSLHKFVLKDGQTLHLAINVTIKRRLFKGIVKTPVFAFLPPLAGAREGMSLVCEFRGGSRLNFTATVGAEPAGTSLYDIEPQFAEVLHAFLSTGDGFFFDLHGPDGLMVSVPIKSSASYNVEAMGLLSRL